MSLLPYPFDDFTFRRPYSPMYQHFGMGLNPEDILAVTPMMQRQIAKPWLRIPSLAGEHIFSNIKIENGKMQINLDMQHFAPEEIRVKTADGFIVVEGQHEERPDEHGYIARKFTRRYQLPEGAPLECVESKLSSDGVLTITAPTSASAVCGERPVHITHTGPVRKELKGVQDILPVTDKKETCKNLEKK